MKGSCLSVDNFVTISDRKACYMSKVSECCRDKAPNLHSGSLNILCVICINDYYP